MVRRYLSITLHLISAVHLSFSVFSHYTNDIPASVFPIDSAFGGKFKFLTFWNECIEAGFFCLALIYDVLQSRLDRGSGGSKSPLKGFLDYMYSAIVFPLSMMVVTAFWGLFLVDRELVMPKAIDPYFPSWLNHSVHSMIAVYSILEMFITYRPLPSLGKSISGLSLLNGLYIIWIHIVYSESGLWVYPILSKLALPYRIAFLLSNFVACVALLFVGRYVSSFVWKKRIIQDSRKKRK